MSVPVGNPYSPAILEQGILIPDTVWCQPRISFAEDWTLFQELTSSKIAQPIFNGSSQIFSCSWSILERFDVSLSLGTAQNKYRFLSNFGTIEGKVSGGMIWYGETKLILLEILDTGFSLFGEAGGSSFMKGPALLNEQPLKENSDFKMRFWKVGGAISQKIGPFVPYIGAFVCHSCWKGDFGDFFTIYLRQKKPVGALLGCSFSKGKVVSLNLEWRGWNEESITISGELRW